MTVPAGYMQDGQGNLVPDNKVKPQHKLEDEMVRDLAQGARAMSQALAAFKDAAFKKVGDFNDMLAQEYDAKKGGPGGNVSFHSYDGTLRVQVAVSEGITFGPELRVAKALIDEFVEAEAQGASDNMRALVAHAFQVGKSGKIDTGRVLGLRKLDISDPIWRKAMEAISDAVRTTSSKTYIRFYDRDPETDELEPIALDLAKV